MDFDQVCENRSAMSVRCLPMMDGRGADLVVVTAKMAYEIDASGRVVIAYAPVRLHDVMVGRSVRLPSDYLVEKPGTDVLLVGTAYPPPHKAVTEMLVRVRVGPVSKTVRVHGARVYQRHGARSVAPGAATPLAPTPLVYERAYGGVDESNPALPLIERRNPVGTGVARDPLSLLGTPAPQLEDPLAPLDSASPAPAAFGPTGPDWEPRRRFAGAHDERWRRERAPVPPADWSPRHNCSAPEGLWSEAPLVGNEVVEVVGATPEGLWHFQLPRYTPLFGATVRGKRSLLATHLDTFLIDADARRVELCWRAALPLPRKAEFVEAITVVGSEPLPLDVFGEHALEPRHPSP